jgi:hypothetical protein
MNSKTWWLLALSLAIIFLAGCVVQQQPMARSQGVIIQVLDGSGNVVATDSYKSAADTNSLQAVSGPNPFNQDVKRYKFKNSTLTTFKTTKDPQIQIIYVVQNTGDTPILFDVNAYIEGYYYKNSTTGG